MVLTAKSGLIYYGIDMRTRLTELLDIEHPIMLAGMGGVSYSELVAAVSEAGGIGTFGAAPMGPGQLAEELDAVRKLTSKPFGVDLLAAIPGQLEKEVETIIKGGARIFVAGLGVPREIIDVLHKNNILVGSMCGKVRHAEAALMSGCDFVVAQGTEGGGHTGTVATMALVPQVVDAVGHKIPVVAAGGLFDGRGLAAALALGAAGFVPKTMGAKSMVFAVKFMIAGEKFAPFEFLFKDKAENPFGLSGREKEVLIGICAGKSNKEIARDLELQEVTVKMHVRSLTAKMAAKNRTHAAMIARESHIV